MGKCEEKFLEKLVDMTVGYQFAILIRFINYSIPGYSI